MTDTAARTRFANASQAVTSPEQLGVLLMRNVLRSAADNQITSEDGKSLLVPIGVEITPHEEPGPVMGNGSRTCNSLCWTVLGHNIICHKVCTEELETAFRHGRFTDDTLRRRHTSGPPLADREAVAAALRSGSRQAASASELGTQLVTGLLELLASGKIPLNDDGKAEIEMTAEITLPDPTLRDKVKCWKSCFTLFGFELSCLEKCSTKEVIEA